MNEAACQAKSGFFTMRSCDRAAIAACGACGRRVCEKHLAGGPRATVCLDCEARRRDATQQGWDDARQGWVYRYRRSVQGRYGADDDDLYGSVVDLTLWSAADYAHFDRGDAYAAAGAEGGDPDGWYDEWDDAGFGDS